MIIARRSAAALEGAFAHLQLSAGTRAFSSSGAVMAAAVGGRKKLDASIPLPPRAPASPYILFFKDWFAEHREEFLTSEGKVRSSEAAKEAGRQWQALDAAAQKRYVTAGKARSDAYKRDYAAYYASLSPEQLRELNAHLPRPLPVPADHPDFRGPQSASQKAERRARTGEPEKGTTGFFAFLAEFRKSDELKQAMEEGGITKAASAVFTAKKAGEKWGVMSEADKKSWADKASSNRTAYKEWKSKQPSP